MQSNAGLQNAHCTPEPPATNPTAVQRRHKGYDIATKTSQDHRSQCCESGLKVIDVFPPGIVLIVTDIESNEFKKALKDEDLRERAKSRNEEDLLEAAWNMKSSFSPLPPGMLASFPGA